MTTSTIPSASKRKEIVRHGPSSLCLCTALVHSQWDRPKKGGKGHDELAEARSLGKTSTPFHRMNPQSGSRNASAVSASGYQKAPGPSLRNHSGKNRKQFRQRGSERNLFCCTTVNWNDHYTAALISTAFLL
jgi:hypothetical protein